MSKKASLWELWKRPEVKAALRKRRQAQREMRQPNGLSSEELALVLPFLRAEIDRSIARGLQQRAIQEGHHLYPAPLPYWHSGGMPDYRRFPRC